MERLGTVGEKQTSGGDVRSHSVGRDSYEEGGRAKEAQPAGEEVISSSLVPRYGPLECRGGPHELDLPTPQMFDGLPPSLPLLPPQYSSTFSPRSHSIPAILFIAHGLFP